MTTDTKKYPLRGSNETDEHKYARHTRNATVFIAIVVGIVVALQAAAVIMAAVFITKAVSNYSNSSTYSNSSNCYSQGGTDFSC